MCLYYVCVGGESLLWEMSSYCVYVEFPTVCILDIPFFFFELLQV